MLTEHARTAESREAKILEFATKSQYFEWIEQFASLRQNYASASINNLKDVQDHYAISILSRSKNLRVLEVGGGDCRVLRNFGDTHECWNAERFTGLAIGPSVEYKYPNVRNVHTHLGEFSKDLPDNYFDLVFSISVVEHIEDPHYADFFKDIARVLRPGGLTAHAIDLYVFDRERLDESAPRYAKRRMDLYQDTTRLTEGQLRFKLKPGAGNEPVFRCDYASNSDREMLAWNRYAPSLTHIRAISQSVTLLAEWEKV